MGKTDKEVLELCKAWFEDIMERSDRLTTGNVSHGSRAIHGTAKSYAEFVDGHLKSRWKPSDKQMEVLLSEVNAWTKGCPKQKILKSLYDDLLKLKG